MNERVLRLSPASLRKLRNSLLNWYERNKRDLPWRQNADPYSIWVSEVMLQQTRVAAVLDHYARFMQKFPTVQALAGAREPSVLAAWSGLGYYHRARRMHEAAKVIMCQRHGDFPRTAEEWRKLPGIGRYTAAAIASIAFGDAVAVVDGNVERVLTRMFGHAEGREAIWRRAEMLLDRELPGDFNQAMMELGATVCTPRAPQCLLCPLNRWCKFRGSDAVRSQAARKHKQLCYALVRKGKDVLLAQRPANASLMAAMWELPAIAENRRDGNEPVARLRHSITDTDYDVLVFSAGPGGPQTPKGNTRWFSRRQWERLPLTGLTRKVLRLVESRTSSKESNQSQ
jgi:A/G-specific adenine glycosylase